MSLTVPISSKTLSAVCVETSRASNDAHSVKYILSASDRIHSIKDIGGSKCRHLPCV